jgi:hypothetical protein
MIRACPTGRYPVKHTTTCNSLAGWPDFGLTRLRNSDKRRAMPSTSWQVSLPARWSRPRVEISTDQMVSASVAELSRADGDQYTGVFLAPG